MAMDFEERARALAESLPEPVSDAIGAQLPFWPDPERAAPSAILRSALFGLVKKGERSTLKRESLAAWPGCKVLFTGQRLDQADEDVWLQAVHLHRLQDLPSSIVTTNRGFLSSIGRSASGPAVTRLHESLERLVACAVTIETPQNSYQGNLISEWLIEKGSGRLIVSLNPRFAQSFAHGLTRIDWEARQSLRTDLARWLHGYVQSHRATARQPHRIGVARLRELSGSTTVLKDFRRKLKAACQQLEDQHVVTSWKLTANDALEIVRPHRNLLKN